MDLEKMNSLAAMAGEVDADVIPPTPEQIAEEEAAEARGDTDTQARAWGMLAFSIGGMLSVLAPELKGVYTETACLAWGHSVVPVAEKYGWDGPSNVPELGLLMASVPLAVPTFFIVRERIKELRAQAAKAEDARQVEAAPAGGA